MSQTGILLEEDAVEVVSVGIEQKCQQEEEAYGIGNLKETVGRLPASHNLYQKEEDIATVESRYGNYIHEGENYGQECRNLPERHPIPLGRE